jgi:hypothetical protein
VTEKSNTGLTWEHRLALWLPRPLLFGAFLIGLCLGAAYLSFQWFFELRVERGAFGIGSFLVIILITPAYFFGPFDRQNYEAEVQNFYIPRSVIRVSRSAGVAGVVAFVGLWELLLISQGHTLVSPWIQLHNGTAATAMFLLLGWITGRFGYFIYAGIWHKPGPQKSDIDLLNLEKIHAFGRSGLHGALVWFITLAIASFLILPELGSGLWVVLPVFAMHIGGGLMFLLSPAREVRNLIRDVKREELGRLEPLLRQARDDTLTGDVSKQGRLTDLLSYKTQIESTPEWPFDSSTLLRFGLYLLIPVASMVGGALVERVVDMLLD